MINITKKTKILYFYKTIYILGRLFSTFFLPMENDVKKIKNLKISVETHEILKTYCEKRGIKMYRFLERLIIEKCKPKKDIYGED
ncbi:MAG: hypothetical protein EBS55_08700 [Flavobacteriaceae bacterium]|nr:hypothetical protein [Flavobacteriaceae bacterium]